MPKLLTCLVVLLFSSFALATESALAFTPQYSAKAEAVQFQNEGQTIQGILTVPEGKTGLCPIVIFFHGFTGNKHELPVAGTKETVFGMAARLFAEQGLATLRIDFRGSGESGGKWEETTFSGQISDGLAAVNYVHGLKNVDQNHIAVLGFSQGGLVAACVTSRDARVKSTILWSPIATPAWTGFHVLGVEAVHKGLQDREALISVTLPWGVPIQLKGAYFQDLFRVDPIAEISHCSRPLLVVVGLKDMVVTPQPKAGELYLLYHPGIESLIILDADHVFHCMQSSEYVDKAIYWSLTWAKKTLVE